MIPSPVDFGCCYLCDAGGVIERVLREDLQPERNLAGENFKDLFDLTSRVKAHAFLEAVRKVEIALDWELILDSGHSLQPLHFAGAAAGESLLICGVPAAEDLVPLLSGIVTEGLGEQAAVDEAIGQLQSEASQRFTEFSFYDEFSRLNNELVNAQRELHKKNDQLHRLNEEKNQALGVVAHDLRNPINVLHMSSAYLRQAAADRLTDDELSLLKTMHRTADSMSRLVNNVLDAAAIEAGSLNLHLDRVSIHDIVEDVFQRLRLIARDSDVQLELHLPEEDALAIEGDRDKLEQVFSNLIDNAIKFSPAGETVCVEVRRDGGDIESRVIDQGPGMTEDLVSQLFRPFGTSHTSAHGKSGTGLGLSIAKRIVEGHHGTIDVRTAPSAGATFVVRLPSLST